MDPEERRPIVHISSGALVVYKSGAAPRPLPWDEVVQREGRISVSGATVVDWLRDQLRHRALDAWLLGVPAVLLAQFVLLLLFVILHGLLFWGPGSSSFRPLSTAGAIAAIPPTVLTAFLGLWGLSQGGMLGTYLLTFGLNFLFMSGRLQIGDELLGTNQAEESLSNVLGGLEASQIEQMRDQGLLAAEDYEVAMELLSGDGETPPGDREDAGE